MTEDRGLDLTRRRLVRTVGTAAWAAPVIVASTAAPAMAVSGGGPPAITTSDVGGVRSPVFGGDVDCTITFTNNGGDASALSVVVDFAIVLPGSLTYGVSDVSAPWTSSPHTVTPGGFRVTFTRAGGLPAANADTLTFTINSAMGTGNIVVSPPMTTPPGAHTGSTGVWGDAAPSPINMQVTGLHSNNTLGNITVTIRNSGTLAAATQTVAMTITPTSGTFSYSSLSANNPSNWAVSPPTVAATSSPTTIEFTSPVAMTPTTSKSFSFHIDETGAGTLSATVTDPASSNNNTKTGAYV